MPRWAIGEATGETVLKYGLRFLAGGIAVSAFATLGDMLRPKSFAGLLARLPRLRSLRCSSLWRARALLSQPRKAVQ
jgi:hypothetical protein